MSEGVVHTEETVIEEDPITKKRERIKVFGINMKNCFFFFHFSHPNGSF